MSDEIQPALTDEEWEMGAVWRKRHMLGGSGNHAYFEIRWNAGGGTPGRNIEEFSPPERHALAALALYQQPFGFTQEDVDDMRWVAMEFMVPDTGASNRMLERASRIAAMLPPVIADGPASS